MVSTSTWHRGPLGAQLSRSARRTVTFVLWDCLSWVAGVAVVVATRYVGVLPATQWRLVAGYLLAACLVQCVVGTLLKVYRGKFQVGSFEEGLGLALSVLITASVVAVVYVGIHGGDPYPRGLAVLTPPIAVLLMAAGRLSARSLLASARPRGEHLESVFVYGAGSAGSQLIRLIAADPRSPYRVVGLIDDDPKKRNRAIAGVHVLGDRTRLIEQARRLGVGTVVLAVPSASARTTREVADLVEGAGMTLLVLPPVAELLSGRVRLSDVRKVDITDLLGRRQVHTNVASIAAYLTGKRVLVTGAGGSIGSELARQVHSFGPAELVLLDRDESALHAVELSIYGTALLDTPDMALADIRDVAALRKIFATHRPDVVLHAAALKHLPMLEQYPEEAWKTNVVGTLNLLRLSAEFGIERFVNISTDKAADPSCVLGRSKRAAERLTAWFALHAEGTYLSVRFGNVLASRGSALHTFQQQIEQGGPVTVTHPEITRYFMTIPEACELVIQAGAIGDDAEVLVLDMGEPVKIVDIARRMIAESGKDVEIVFTGLRPGEKMHETLLGKGEVGVRRLNPLISHVPVPPLAPGDLTGVRGQFLIGRSVGAPGWHGRTTNGSGARPAVPAVASGRTAGA